MPQALPIKTDPRANGFSHGLGRVGLALMLLVILMSVPTLSPRVSRADTPARESFRQNIDTFASYGDRKTGTPGAEAAARYIMDSFEALGFETVGLHRFSLPVLDYRGGTLIRSENNQRVTLSPLRGNIISPPTIAEPGLTGPVIYVGSGRIEEFNDKEIEGSIVLMELGSGKNWLTAAALGAKALIYVDRGRLDRKFFEEKLELTPLDFPRFWMPLEDARQVFGGFETAAGGLAAGTITLVSDVRWQDATPENVYCLIPGRDPDLGEELILVEAFYDSSYWVLGRSPGADEAVSVATLLQLAQFFKDHPPERSILLVATSGHAQALAGMRELIWSLRTRSREMRKDSKEIDASVKSAKEAIDILAKYAADLPDDLEEQRRLVKAVSDQLKTEIDRMTTHLMRLRLEDKDNRNQALIKELANKRLILRRLGWRSDLAGLQPDDRAALLEVIPKAEAEQKVIHDDLKRRQKLLKSARKFRGVVNARDVSAMVSLHLSSHGSGLGAFNKGFLYPLKYGISRIAAYSKLDEVLHRSAEEGQKRLGLGPMFKDTLRPSRIRSWETWFIDSPPLGGEVSALAGYLGFTLATVDDARRDWGTPYDESDHVDFDYAFNQGALVCHLVETLASGVPFRTDNPIQNGFSTITGRANFIRHGELFPDQAAPGTTILAYQGPAAFHSQVDASGNFILKGMADRAHVNQKVIIEGYKFDPETGRVIWAIDKNNTGKAAYRLKLFRRSMETSLIMFGCREMTLFNLLEPRSFNFMTKIQLIDGRTEAWPLRYWWSRIDTRSSTILSLYLEPGTHLKMTLSDTVLNKKMILTHAEKGHPNGVGYHVEKWPALHHTEYLVARDMWALLGPRIANLEKHGIYNEKIRQLRDRGEDALEKASKALENKQYDRFTELSARSWALASRVYFNVEDTQKDVLFGVLFYIALFVPFAFCLERFLFAYSDINKRILAFSGILLLLIFVIYQVHPAFQLAYSPMVVILAFFIMGLSLIVTLIIFFRFEEEMTRMQRRARQMVEPEISRWKAFVAAFLLGVSNLRRRRLRTILTCLTLIILTFTIMSFTSVQSLRRHARVLFRDTTPYIGYMLKNVSWRDIPPQALQVIGNTFREGLVAPRVWLETLEKNRTTRVPIKRGSRFYEAQGMVGLSSTEPQVTGLDKILIGGRWFEENERQAVLLPELVAEELGLDPHHPQGEVLLWGVPYKVVGVFKGKSLDSWSDLDGEPPTPATFPDEASEGLSEAEVEALESGDDIRAFQSRYQHTAGELTVIVPYQTLMAAGGNLKAVAVKPHSVENIQAQAEDLVDRFQLAIFIGEQDGTYMYNASDTLSYSGVPNVLIPIAISIFIVLNTMIGSVYERKSEIAIYTSVGLAPSHVSFLFIAESMAFAVLSVVLGYIMAQVSAAFLAKTSLWSGITVNYSSLAGVAAMFLVFVVVLVSVIYPSRVAASIAIPDVNRSWTLPEAKDNKLDILLPVLLKHSELQGIGGYIYSYFESHRDVSHGLFSTGEIHLDIICPSLPVAGGDGSACTMHSCDQNACLGFSTTVWLAPFDFGIMQEVQVHFCPADNDPGFLEIRVHLVRETGEANAWHRINKAFIHQLRKPMLAWRSLGAEAQKEFGEKLEQVIQEDASGKGELKGRVTFEPVNA